MAGMALHAQARGTPCAAAADTPRDATLGALRPESDAARLYFGTWLAAAERANRVLHMQQSATLAAVSRNPHASHALPQPPPLHGGYEPRRRP